MLISKLDSRYSILDSRFSFLAGIGHRASSIERLSSVFCFVGLLVVLNPVSLAVTSKLTRHSTQADFLKGETENVIIDSRGTIRLARAWSQLAADFKKVWAINTIVADGQTLFLGTSPNGRIYKYHDGRLTKIYPPAGAVVEGSGDSSDPNSVAEPNAPETVRPRQYLTNEHIFAMAMDNSGRLLAGISGEKCRLIRFKQDLTGSPPGRAPGPDGARKEWVETIFEPDDAKYIFAIAPDKEGHLYLGTGPEGKLYRLGAADGSAQRSVAIALERRRLVYDIEDKNILSLAVGPDGFIYAGSDRRALVYKINPQTCTASVMYDTDQAEIAALLFDDEGNLYAAATSAQAVKTQAKVSAPLPSAVLGRPERKPEKQNSAEKKDALKLKIPNTTRKAAGAKGTKEPAHPARGAPPPGTSHLYRITKDGFITDLFQQQVIFYCLIAQDNELLIATGNSAQLFALEPETEQQRIAFEDKQASQITALAVLGDDVYLGTANPAKLIKLEKSFAAKGTFTSDLIDAGQPARWGKLHLEADIPKGSQVVVSARSGNVKDVNDPTFSPWTDPVEVIEPVGLFCPLGRFCQYRLGLVAGGAADTPVIREVAVAHSVPNLAPKVESVNVSRIEAKGKLGRFKISFKAKDGNADKLIYKIEFRKIGRTGWIELKDELETDSFEWDGRTVEDGRYEVKVTASDERDNTAPTKLFGTRISDPVVIDNTAPFIERASVITEGKNVRLILQITDRLSAIGKLSYTVDSNDEWKGVLPEDAIYDTTSEEFAILIEDLAAGEHVIALKIDDAVDNTMYKTFDATIEQE